MIDKSRYCIGIPRTDLLTYTLRSSNSNGQDEPLWINADISTISLTRTQALEWAASFAIGLHHLGISKDDVVLVLCPNHVHLPVAFIAIIAYGAVFTAASSSAVVREVEQQILQTQAKLVLVHPRLVAVATEAAKNAGLPKHRVFLFCDTISPGLHGIQDIGSVMGSPDEVRSWQWPSYSEERCTKAVAVINFSSGTTGVPKGVCISQANLISNSEQSIFMRYLQRPRNASTKAKRTERWLGFLPLYHAFGQLVNVIMACRLGVPVYVMETFHYANFLHHIQTHRITDFTTAPPVLVMMSKRPETSDYDLSSLREVLSGAAPLSKELQNDLTRRFKFNIRQTFGGTELTCSSHAVPGGVEDFTGSVGFLYPNMECKLLDESGQEMGIGHHGEAYLKGPNVCLGYWQNDLATQAAIDEEGFYRTGDVCIRDQRGFYYVLDRIKEMIKVNGLQVAPAELEAILLQHGDVADAGVVAIKRRDEELPRAYVVLKEHARGRLTESELEGWVSERVAKHKRLTGGVVFVQKIPKSPTGKIQRKVLKQLAHENGHPFAKSRL